MLFYYKKSSIGLMFIIGVNKEQKDWSGFRDFIEIMMYKYKLKTIIMYKCTFYKESDTIPNIDFEVIENEWKFNLDLERKSKEFNFKGMRKIDGLKKSLKY